MRQFLKRSWLVLSLFAMTIPAVTMSVFAKEPESAEAKYQAAIKAAEVKYQQSTDQARATFLKEVKAAGLLLKSTSAPASKPQDLSNLPVTVTGAEPKPLVEGAEQTGWFDLKGIVLGTVIFEPKDSEPKDGVVQFQIQQDCKIGLAASWAYDGNASGGWQEDRQMKKDLLDSGWKEIGLMYWNQTDRHTLFTKDFKKGELAAVRTRKYRRPFVFLPDVVVPTKRTTPKGVVDDAVEVLGAKKQESKTFFPKPEDIPEAIQDTDVFISPLHGVAVVRVHQPTTVYVAVSWVNDGNTSGQWTEERWNDQDFKERGFKEIGTVAIPHRGSLERHSLFFRECKKDENFRIRTRKYGAPFVFVPAS